jgi:NADH-quinone oxidoreductase subunit L
VFPAGGHAPVSHSIEYISIATPLLGLLIAYLLFLGRQLSIAGLLASPTGQRLQQFFYSGWGIDRLYQAILVQPFSSLAHWWRNEPVDYLYNALVSASQWGHKRLAALQTGELRWYVTTMAFGLVLMLTIMLRNAT